MVVLKRRSMPRLLVVRLLALGFLAAPSRVVLAQDSVPSHRPPGIPRWATLSVGFGSPPRTALLLSATLQTRPALFTLRLTGNFARRNGPNESDLALLVMRATPARALRAVAGAGIALAAVDDGTRGFYHPINRHTLVGLPLEVQGLWCFNRALGLGLTGFADLNGRRAFGGLTLGLVWGAFWAPGTPRGG